MTADDATVSTRDSNAQLTFSSAPRHRPTVPQSFNVRSPSLNARVDNAHKLPDARYPPLNPYSPYAAMPSRSPYISNMSHSPFVAINDTTLSAQHDIPPVPMTSNNPSALAEYHEDTGPFDSSLLSNYLNMLSQDPDDHVEQESCPVGLVTHGGSRGEICFAHNKPSDSCCKTKDSSTFRPNLETMSQYLTSPFEDDSPLEDFLETPVDNNVFPSPEVANYGDMFPEFPLLSDSLSRKTINTPTVSPPNLNLNDLYTMPDESPLTANDDEHNSMYSSSRHSSHPPTSARTSATGVRKNIKPDALIPADAPTQPRKYHTPSATSRKNIPIAFARKRARSRAFGDEDDELANEDSALTPTEAQLIETKRRQNTIAARKSRKKRLEYLRELEESVEILTKERDEWRSRALISETMLKHHGLEAPPHTTH
jgi:hypothetical protein